MVYAALGYVQHKEAIAVNSPIPHEIPEELQQLLGQLDDFIESEVRPLEESNDNIRFFDHRREDARTDWERGGLPNDEWEDLLHQAKRMADAAGFYRYPFPAEYGGSDGTIYGMAVIREHLARRGLGLHNDLQNEHSIVGNNVGLLLMINYGTEEQKADWVDDLAEGRRGFAFGITEPEHGSDATHMDTHAVKDGDEWIINGEKTWNTGIHKADCDLILQERVEPPATVTASRFRASQLTARDSRISLDIQYAQTAHIRLTDVRVFLRNIRRRGRCRWCSTFSTKTGFAKQHQVLVPPNSASMNR